MKQSRQHDQWHPLLWHINVLISLALFWEFYNKDDIRKFRALNNEFRSDEKIRETHMKRAIKDIFNKWRLKSVRCQMSDIDVKIMEAIQIAKIFREQYFQENQIGTIRADNAWIANVSDSDLFSGARYPLTNNVNYNTAYYIPPTSNVMFPINRDCAIDSIYIHTCLRDVDGSIEIICKGDTIFKIKIKHIFSGLSDEFIKATDYVKVPFLKGGVYIFSLELGFSSLYLEINLYNDKHLTILQDNMHINFIKVTYVNINIPIYNINPIGKPRYIKWYMGDMSRYRITYPNSNNLLMGVYHLYAHYNIFALIAGVGYIKYI